MIKVEITKQMEMVLYHSEQSDVTVNAIIKDETIWITQKAMAELFGIDKSGISRHLSNIFKSGELDEKVVVAKIATTNQHGAIEGKTAEEIVYDTADHTKDNMGLTTWKNAPDGRILKSDTSVAKNYLNEKQIRQLERAVTGYFDYVEDLIERENVFTMQEFSDSINAFLEFRRYDILRDNGKVSHRQALEKAYHEYEIFNKTQPIESDFDKVVKEIENKR